MDLLKEIRDKINSNSDRANSRGLKSVLTHIEIAERYYHRAKAERDEHLYTDVIYRTNHAFEGILKEAYSTLAERSADRLSAATIEDYLLETDTLRSRLTDLLTNYRKNWRNPSTHDHQLFFSEQESFLAIVTVSAFASILLDRILEKEAYKQKAEEFGREALRARDHITAFSTLAPIDKVTEILRSFGAYYIQHYQNMSQYPRGTANAQMAAFIEKVAPEISVRIEHEFRRNDAVIRFDLLATVEGTDIGIETREPRRDHESFSLDADTAISQLAGHLKAAGLCNGVVFFYPGDPEHDIVTTTSSSSWPASLSLREVFSDDPSLYADAPDQSSPAVLVTDTQGQ